MIDNFAIAFFTICIIYTVFRAVKLERADKESGGNVDKQLEVQQTQAVLDDVFPRNTK